MMDRERKSSCSETRNSSLRKESPVHFELFPQLGREEVIKSTRVIRNRRIFVPDPALEPRILACSPLQILVTGMPKLGKTTTLRSVSQEFNRLGIANKLMEERPPRYNKDFGDDSRSLHYNMSMATHGLTHLGENFFQEQDPNLVLYDRMGPDQIAWAKALTKFYGGDRYYKQMAIDFGKFVGHYLSLIDAVVICNSSTETSIKKGCNLPSKLLEYVSMEFRNLPNTLRRMNPRYHHLITISIDFESEMDPYDFLKRSIRSLIKWSNEGMIKIPTSTH